jgi:hypothetical protein
LSLILGQNRSFEEIAAMLRMDRREVRARAHAAADQLAPHRLPSADARGRIVDYLLGEQSISERAATRSELAAADNERKWALALAHALEPLARDPLPAIPLRKATRTRRRVLRRRPRPRLPSFYVLASIVGATCVVAAILILIAEHPNHKAPRARPAKSQPNAAQTLHRLVLQPAGPQKTAFGAAAIVRQNGSMLLLLQARGLTPNHRDSYAVWLFNTPADSRLLGFVTPLVGPDGTFSSGVSLPDDAVRFRNLVITRETAARPTVPGKAILRSPLSLS